MCNKTTFWVECGASLPNNKFTRNHIIPANKINSFRFKYDNTGVYVTAYFYDNKDLKNANLIGDFYLDLDYNLDVENAEDAFNVVRQDAISATKYLKILLNIDPEDIQYFFSGSKGIHIIVPKEILGVQSNKNLNRHYRLLAEDINQVTSGKTIDLKIYDNRRLFRLSNSIHQKTGLYKVYINYNELCNLTFNEIKKIAENPRAIPKRNYTVNPIANMTLKNYAKKFEMIVNRARVSLPNNVKLDYMPPCVEYLFNNPVGEGQRNDTTAFLASYLKQCGIPFDKAIERLYRWNEEYCDPMLPEKEIDTTVASIYNGTAKMGCSTAKILSECNEKECKLYERKRRFTL